MAEAHKMTEPEERRFVELSTPVLVLTGVISNALREDGYSVKDSMRGNLTHVIWKLGKKDSPLMELVLMVRLMDADDDLELIKLEEKLRRVVASEILASAPGGMKCVK